MAGGTGFGKTLGNLALLAICLYLVDANASNHGRSLSRKRKAIFQHYTHCPNDIHVTAQPGKTCAIVSWREPPEESDKRPARRPGDCFSEGDHQIKYVFNGALGLGFVSGDTCKFTVHVNVYYCFPSPSSISHVSSQCTGDANNVNGATCTFRCNQGYIVHGTSSVTCHADSSSNAWSDSFPTCLETCSLVTSHCWPGDCAGQLASNCQCRPGFKPVTVQGGRHCDLDTPPDMDTCRVSLIDSGNAEVRSGYSGIVTSCNYQRDEIMNTQPTQLKFTISAHLNLSLGHKSAYIQDSKVGIIGTNVSILQITAGGMERLVTTEYFNTNTSCNMNMDPRNPVGDDTPVECSAVIDLHARLQDGDRLCADMQSLSGGFYLLQDETTHAIIRSPSELFTPVSRKKRICFLYDQSKPTHCSEQGCHSEPLTLSTRLTRQPQVKVSVEGWRDPIPPGGSEMSISNISMYKLEVHNVLSSGFYSPLSMEPAARDNYTHEWTADSSLNGSYDLIVTLPDEEPRLYALFLEVHDHAGEHGNVAYARRFVLYDNSSAVAFNGTLIAASADSKASFEWQTNVFSNICLNWAGQFYNNKMKQNNFLQSIEPDNSSNIAGNYEQTTGLLPVSGTENIDGVVKFEMSWRRNEEVQTPFKETADFKSQASCLSEPLKDGQTYQIWIRATDIMNNTEVASTVVHIDHTGPEISIFGLQGRLGRQELYFHNSTDLSAMLLAMHVSDPHSGILTLQISVGTRYLSDDVAQYAEGVHRFDNVTSCAGQEHCYCPSVGPCEDYNYLITLNKAIDVSNRQGLHHREYYIKVNATNNAKLSTTKNFEVLIDASPPTVGVVLEGLSDDDKAEMDFTSNDVIEVRWPGFLDSESGIVLYRAALAERCLTLQELEALDNATEVETGYSATLSFPEEGHYRTSVVAYNGAMQPSSVTCSDGITFDTSAPRMLNVSIFNSRSGRAVACTSSNDTWLINANVTRVKLAGTAACLSACLIKSSSVDVEHLPLSSEVPLDDELSSDLCLRLPLMTEDHHVFLPSDYLRVDWDGLDAESQMEDYFIGMGSERSRSSAPDLLPFTTTHGRNSYHARHAGLDHGALFYVFLRAINKAGLEVLLTLGPVIIDVTPPYVATPLQADVKNGFLIVTWTNDTISDPEQPSGMDFEISFRVGHSDGFVTPLLSLPESSGAHCQQYNVTGCAHYPVAALHAHDSPEGRSFFLQLHVTNIAGHVTSVNTSGVRLPVFLPPNHGVVMDVIRSGLTEEISAVTPVSSASISEDDSNIITFTFSSGVSSPAEVENIRPTNNLSDVPSSYKPSPLPTPEFSKDIDVGLRRDDLCIAWSGFYHPQQTAIEVGIGSFPNQDDVIQFSMVKSESPFCVNASDLPYYTKLFSVVRASNSGGATVFSSDGFQMIPEHDTDNKLKVFIGKGCSFQDIIGSLSLRGSETSINLTDVVEVPVHPGDNLFVRFSPFVANVRFPDARVLQSTLTGYQIITKHSHLSADVPSGFAQNTTLEVLNCLIDKSVSSASRDEFDIFWEITGPWSSLIKTKKMEIVDETCLKASSKKHKTALYQCMVVNDFVDNSKNKSRLQGNIIPGHHYSARVIPCFDNGCLPSISSTMVAYDTVLRSVNFGQFELTMQTPEHFELSFSAELQPAIDDEVAKNWPCLFKWSIATDSFGSSTLIEWTVSESDSCSDIQVKQAVDYPEIPSGTIYVCLQIVYPLKSEIPSCQELNRPRSLNTAGQSFHLIELAHSTLRTVRLEDFLHSQQLGSRLHQLYDLDVDIISSSSLLSAIVTDGEGRNITWFLMTRKKAALGGDCQADADCLTSTTSRTGSVVFSRAALFKVQNGHTYYACAIISPGSASEASAALSRNLETRSEVCGDGVTIDDTSPVPGSVRIANALDGFLGVEDHVMVTWEGFSDIALSAQAGSRRLLNYSVALGSYPGAEDIAHYVPVGQRTTWTFDHLVVIPGTSCYATVKAEDPVGHVTQVSSESVILDTTPPTLGHVFAGTITRKKFVSGQELPVHWDYVVDRESGIQSVEIAVVSEGGQIVIPFQRHEGQSATLKTVTGQLVDGHSYIFLLKATNRAGLTAMTSSDSFVVDDSPPSPGVVWNSGRKKTVSYSTEIGEYPVHWSGFEDPHSGLAYFRVGLGSAPGEVDIHPMVYIGLQTSYVWKHEFDQGHKYYVSVEACNQASACHVMSSSSMTFDNSPPLPGLVTVGYDGHHNKFIGHNWSLPVRWVGFSDPQSGIKEFSWCAGMTPGTCDVIPLTHTMLSRGTLASGLALPVAIHLYVTVRARNNVDLETVSVSDSFQVDITPPEVSSPAHFLSPRDGSRVFSQWDRSVLRLAWNFLDPDSSVISHSVNIRSRLTGRLVIDTLSLAADTQVTLTLDKDHLLLDGDSHWAVVTACNAAGLCSSSSTGLLLVDSSPPVAGNFLSPLTWGSLSSATAGRFAAALHLAWKSFSDAESGVVAYEITAGRVYNGEDLSDGVVRVLHNNATAVQTHTLELTEELNVGDVVYLSIKGENQLGLNSSMVHMAYIVLVDGPNKTSGSLVLIRHSCEIAYCTKECTCAATGTRCQRSSPCQHLDASASPHLSRFFLRPYIGLQAWPQVYSTSVKCLEGYWVLQDPTSLSNVSRFEWSFSLFNKTDGEGVFDIMEPVWHDVGRATRAVYCLPDNRVLAESLRYVLHVRVWMSRDQTLTFTSQPVLVDNTPPKAMKNKNVIDSVASCVSDVDHVTTEPYVTACWNGVFQDVDSQIAQYEVWVGTTPLGSDHTGTTFKSFNTSFEISTSTLEEGTRYYVSVRAWNEAGLQSTLLSDGFLIDNTPPVTGVVFPSRYYGNRHAQSSINSLSASWHGFQDRHSGVTSYHVALYDVYNLTTLVPFTDVGFQTRFKFTGLSLRHGHSYQVMVKARDMAGLESVTANSAHILVDRTPPEGVFCKSFSRQDETTLDFTPTSSFLHDSYTGTLRAGSLSTEELLRVQLLAEGLNHQAAGYIELEELKMPLFFVHSQSGQATAEHVLMVAPSDNRSLELRVVVEGNYGALVTSTLDRCAQMESSQHLAVDVKQMTENVISVCARVLDRESGLRSIRIGLGTTQNGLQVHPMIHVGHSGHSQFNVLVQHGTNLYATVIADNHADQRSRFTSRPIILDRTGPLISEVKIAVEYLGEGQTNTTISAKIEAIWSVEDKESDVMFCACNLETLNNGSATPTYNGTVRRCEWLLEAPRHGMAMSVVITCTNGVQMESRAVSQPLVLLTRNPDMSDVSLFTVSNSRTLSPFDVPNPRVQSSNSSLQFHWTGVNDPTVAQVNYRFLRQSQPLMEWRSLYPLKTSAVLERERNGKLAEGEITLQLQAQNDRHMMSDIVTESVIVVDDSRPALTGRSAIVAMNNTSLHLDWRNVFGASHDVTYSIFAGTSEGFGDVINHVITTTTSVSVPCFRALSDVYVIIQAVDSNGEVQEYKADLPI